MSKKCIDVELWLAHAKEDFDGVTFLHVMCESNKAAKCFISSVLNHTEDLDCVEIECEGWCPNDFSTDEEFFEWFNSTKIHSFDECKDPDVALKLLPKKWFEFTEYDEHIR